MDLSHYIFRLECLGVGEQIGMQALLKSEASLVTGIGLSLASVEAVGAQHF